MFRCTQLRIPLLSAVLVTLCLAALPALAQDEEARALYEEARELLQESSYRSAARLFQEVVDDFPRSEYAGDALYWRAFALYRRGNQRDLNRALEALELQAERYDEAATRADAAELRTRIQGELARHGDADAAARITAEAEELSGQRNSQVDEEMRLAALNALLHMDSDRALPILKRVLIDGRETSSDEMREQAVFLVGQHAGDETEDILLDVIHNDPDSEVRQQAVFWLSQVPTDRAIDVLESVLRESDDEELQAQAVFALSQHGSPRAATLLRDLARDPRAGLEAREQAIFWLGQEGGQDTRGFLLELYDQLEDEELREKVIFSIAQAGGREAGAWLLERARDTDEDMEVRKQALFWAGQSGQLDVEDAMELYAQVEDDEMKEQLIFVLSQEGGSDALDALIRIVREETDSELRSNAVFWIGQSGDRRAVEFLEELIGQ